MPAAKKAAARPKRRVVAPADKRTQLRLTVDSKFTKSHFSQLFAVLKIRRKNALAEHIIMNFKTKAAQAQLIAFYNGPWLNIPFQSIDTAFVFPLTYEIADELERVGGEVLGGVNRSKTFRVMVAYFAFLHKLKIQRRPRWHTLSEQSPTRRALGMIVESLLHGGAAHVYAFVAHDRGAPAIGYLPPLSLLCTLRLIRRRRSAICRG